MKHDTMTKAILYRPAQGPDAVRVHELRRRILQRDGRAVEYAEVEQMNEILARYRTRLRATLHVYRSWTAQYERECDGLQRTYAALEGIYLRRQLGDAWQMYCAVNQDYHELRRIYLANLGQQPPHRRVAA